jgi:hypothetical protein
MLFEALPFSSDAPAEKPKASAGAASSGKRVKTA